MNILNETPEARKDRLYIQYRLKEELLNACKEVQKDDLYKMFKGTSRSIMTYEYFINWMPLDDLKIILSQVRAENNKEIF